MVPHLTSKSKDWKILFVVTEKLAFKNRIIRQELEMEVEREHHHQKNKNPGLKI